MPGYVLWETGAIGNSGCSRVPEVSKAEDVGAYVGQVDKRTKVILDRISSTFRDILDTACQVQKVTSGLGYLKWQEFYEIMLQKELKFVCGWLQAQGDESHQNRQKCLQRKPGVRKMVRAEAEASRGGGQEVRRGFPDGLGRA